MIKGSFLEMAKRHQAGNMLVQGEWQTCSVGCFNRAYGNDPDDFAALAKSTGYREWTHHIQAAVFENLPSKDAKNWHVQFAEKMEAVKDFDAFYHSFMIGVLEIALPHDKHGVVQPVIDLHRDYQSATEEDWEEVADAAADWAADWAWDAAWDAARAAAAGAEARAARDAAWAAARAAEARAARDAASDAAWAAAARAARDAANAAVDAAWVGVWAGGSAVRAARVSARDAAWQKISDAFLNADGGE